jgi:hypothetical protein
MQMILAVILFVVSLTQAYVNWEIQGTATKEQHLPAVLNAKTSCAVTLSYEKATESLGADVDCGTGLGSDLASAHIHLVNGQKPLALDFAADTIFTLLPSAPGSGVNTFTYEQINVTEKDIEPICNNLCYINIHGVDQSYNVRLNLVGMDYICNIGKETDLPAAGIVKSWGPEPPVGQMKSWVIKVDLYQYGDSTKPADCTGRLTYETGNPGQVIFTGWCNNMNKIERIGIGMDNETAVFTIDLFDQTPGFYGKIPFTFKQPADSAIRDQLCAATDWDVFLQTDVATYSGMIVIDDCPAVVSGPPPPDKTAAGTLSFAVYLTVFIALLMKWLF